jgi:excisionase family DNA binding protein
MIYYTIKEAAAALHVAPATIRGWAREGLRTIRPGGVTLVRSEDLDAWITRMPDAPDTRGAHLRGIVAERIARTRAAAERVADVVRKGISPGTRLSVRELRRVTGATERQAAYAVEALLACRVLRRTDDGRLERTDVA